MAVAMSPVHPAQAARLPLIAMLFGISLGDICIKIHCERENGFAEYTVDSGSGPQVVHSGWVGWNAVAVDACYPNLVSFSVSTDNNNGPTLLLSLTRDGQPVALMTCDNCEQALPPYSKITSALPAATAADFADPENEIMCFGGKTCTFGGFQWPAGTSTTLTASTSTQTPGPTTTASTSTSSTSMSSTSTATTITTSQTTSTGTTMTVTTVTATTTTTKTTSRSSSSSSSSTSTSFTETTSTSSTWSSSSTSSFSSSSSTSSSSTTPTSSSTSSTSVTVTSSSSTSSSSRSSTSTSSSSRTSSTSSSSSRSTSSTSSSSISSSSTSSSRTSSSSSSTSSSSTVTVSTTTTTSTTTLTALAGTPPVPTVLEWIATLEQSILEELLRNSSSAWTVSKQIPGAAGVAFYVGAGEGERTLKVPGTESYITVPSSIMTKTGERRGAAVAVAIDQEVVDRVFPGMDASGQAVHLNAAVNVNIFSTSGRNRIAIDDLSEPVLVTLSPVNRSLTPYCAYWAEGMGYWETKGVTELLGLNGTADDALVCATSHLTFFAAIWKGIIAAFNCAQLGLFTAEGFRGLFRGDWYLHEVSMLFWLILASLLAMCSMSCLLDKRGRRSWDDQFFLIPLEKSKAFRGEEDLFTSQEAQASSTGSFMGLASSSISGCCGDFSVLKDALDDIASRWCNNFAELRSLAEAVWDGVGFRSAEGAGTGNRAIQLVNSVVGSVVAGNARRQASISLGLSDDIVSFLLEDEDLGMLLQESASVASMNSSDPWDLRLQAWRKLHEAVLKEVNENWMAMTWRSLPSAILKLFIMYNPVASVFLRCRLVSHSLRVLFLSSEVMGALAVTALFFEGTGMATSGLNPEDSGCSDDLDVWQYLGRLIAVAIASTVLATVPMAILSSLHSRAFRKVQCEASPEWHRQLGIWRAQDRVLWAVGLLYNAFCGLFIILFLANVAPSDVPEWGMTTLITIIQDDLALPLVIALVLPLFAVSALGLMSRVQGLELREMLQEHREAIERNGGNWRQVVLAI